MVNFALGFNHPSPKLPLKLMAKVRHMAILDSKEGVCVLSPFDRVQLFATLWTVARLSPLTMGFSRQEYWSGLPCPPPGDLPDPGIELTSYVSCIGRLVLYFTILYWFCHTSTWIRHGCTRVPNPEPPSHLPPHTIPLGHPSAPAPSFLHQTWTGDSFLIWYYTCFNAILPNHPLLPLPQSPKDCSIHLCLFCCLVYRVVVTIFLNSIYMH